MVVLNTPQKETWLKLLRFPQRSVLDFLSDQGIANEDKLKVRCYSLKFSGTLNSVDGICKFISQNIDKFVFSKEKIQELIENNQQPWQEAMFYFGRNAPSREGKYGELLLFHLVETVLKVPLVAHKIRATTNPNDQIKGGDGIFFGFYENNQALLLGESKVYSEKNSAVKSAIESLSRFHNDGESALKLNYELIVASNTITDGLTSEELNYLEKCLDVTTDEYRSNIIVHPVLVMFDDKEICAAESACKNPPHGEELLKRIMSSYSSDLMSLVKNKIQEVNPSVSKVYLDFFFVPVSDVDKFRDGLYELIHGRPYSTEAVGR